MANDNAKRVCREEAEAILQQREKRVGLKGSSMQQQQHAAACNMKFYRRFDTLAPK
jgi:hypothetical protein